MFARKYMSPAVLVSSLMGLSCAHAQSSVNLYGVVDLSVASIQLSGTSAGTDNKRVTKVDGNQMITSYIGLKGVEDLGGGLKAGFVLETFLRPDTGASGRNDAGATAKADPFWSRASNLYLQGDFGKVVIGRQIDPVYAQMVAYNPFGGGFGLSPAIRLSFNNKWGNDKGDSGWSNAVSYSTPSLGGLTLSTAAQAAEVTDGSEGSSYSLAANYVNGPLALGGVWQTVRSVEAPKLDLLKGQRQTFGMLNASYDAGFAKFFAEFGKMGNHGFTGGTRINTSLYQLGASVPVTSSGKVLASFGQSKEKPTEGGTTPVTLHNILTLAYDHWLSKRTDVYVAFMMDNEKQTNFKKGYSYVAGMRHAF